MSDHLETLRQHNEWRRGMDGKAPMIAPAVIGVAIDKTIAEVETLRAQVGGKDDLSQSLIDENERLRAELADAKNAAYREVLAEWQKPWMLSGGDTFVQRLREMCK